VEEFEREFRGEEKRGGGGEGVEGEGVRSSQ
jgi:hypothetical protein